GKAGNDARGPYAQQQKQRERAKDAQIRFASFITCDPFREDRPQLPGRAIEEFRKPKAARGVSRQDNYLERIPQHHGYQDETKNSDYVPHAISQFKKVWAN